MARFVRPLAAKIGHSNVSGKWERVVYLERNLTYFSNIVDGPIIVPEKFMSDGASVPRVLWSIFPPFGIYLPAAILHDFLCVKGRMGHSPINSKQAARVFREAMKVCGVGLLKRNKMYFAVRLFGPKFDAKK